ncbi:WD40 repeat-like protein [Punctularia strigosozonata HHB-11173 SS5]|uniref:WD40 repeat-like protein n=1 Tax=Punctularia strigosozonata (strain HHB-11173) TaxID=741275 RepID=UPI00044180F2|nr:WD40 repeat-like protein [Punctularia strigosozonata HHB-11173 SS5]EIN07210.1 WD40 repeat-like protein [Punctularia strigosozonata HHB-11173 SS5]
MENDSTFVAPEGVYSVTEEHKPTSHTINAVPTLYPTKLATAVVRFPAAKSAAQGLAHLLGGGGNRDRDGKKEKALRPEDASISSSDTEDSPSQSNPDASTSISPESTPQTLFSPSRPSTGRRRTATRPKHNMRTTSSTFITRLHTVEGLTRVLQSKSGDVTFLFYNSAKSFFWTEAGSKAKEPLARITFSAYPTCHDVNRATLSPDRMDVIIGFTTGDLVWFDPITSRYGRLNKGGCITSSPCTAVRWVPQSPTLFLVSHADGTILVYDKEREDFASFVPSEPVGEDGGEWDPNTSAYVTMPPWHPAAGANMTGGMDEKDRKEKDKAKNPVSHWRVSKRSIVDFVFSPDVKYVAAISEDGCLRIIDALAEQLIDCYASYFGALTCVAWSPDNRFVLTGGQDDLVTIVSPWEQRVIARCQGHSSFVSAVAFDDLRCDGRTYRFGSVGEDNKLILWDFSSGALHRPKLQGNAHHQRMSMSSTVSLSMAVRSRLNLPPGAMDAMSRYHPAPSRNEVAVVQPVLVKHLENDILVDIAFLPRGMLTSTKTGQIKLWIRPLAMRSRQTRNGHRGYASADTSDLI